MTSDFFKVKITCSQTQNHKIKNSKLQKKIALEKLKDNLN